MHATYRLLLAGSLLIGFAVSPAVAQQVEWKDDGTVLIKLGEAYNNAVIHTTKEELGSEFGPGKQPFKDVTITVTVNGAGPKGGISGPLYQFRPIWEELSGGKVNIVELPFAEHYTKMMLDLRNGTGQYDAFMVGAFWYGDIVPAGYAYAIDDLQKSGKYPKWTYDDMPESLRKLYTWGGKGYGILNDADGQVLYYRSDILGDPKWQAEYKKATGKDLPNPPQTWQDLLEVSQFFNGKNWDSGDADPDSGTVLHLKVGEQGHYHFQSLSASFVINPGDKVTRTQNVYWFDPVDMKPLINSPGHLKALEFLQELHKTGPSAQVGWSLGEAWDYFLRGKSIFVFSWGDVGALCQDDQPLEDQGQVRRGHAALIDRVLRLREEGFRQARQAASRRQHHRRLMAWRHLELLGQSGGDLLVPVADGDQAGFQADGDRGAGTASTSATFTRCSRRTAARPRSRTM